MKKLKILFLVPSFPSVSETFIVNQIIDLIDRGHEVTIFSTGKNDVSLHPKIIEYELLEKTLFAVAPSKAIDRILLFFKILIKSNGQNRTKLLNSLSLIKHKMDAITLSSFYKVAWFAQTDDDYDIVHAHFGFMNDYFYEAQECGFFKKAKLVVTFHGYDMAFSEIQKNKVRYTRLFDNKTCLTTNNEYAKSQISNIKKGYENIKLIPVGLNTNYYKPRHPKENNKKIRILYCGRLIPFKGAILLVEIANLLVNNRGFNNIEFIILGDGDLEYRTKILNLISKYNLTLFFNFLGSKTQDQVIEEMERSDIFISPGITDQLNRAETQGLVIQEAQSMELPVIVSTAGGMKHGLINNHTGFVVEENNIEEFCDIISLLINDYDLRIKMGKAGREYVKNHFDSKILGKQLEELYFSIL